MTRLNYSTYVGIDVDKNSFAFTINKDKENLKTKKITADPEHLYNYLKNRHNLKTTVCGYEAGPTGFHLYDYLKGTDLTCVLISPMDIGKRPNERVKTNRIDSIKIADHMDSKDVRLVRVPEGIYRELRHLVNLRDNYSRDRKVAKQRIAALLLYVNLHKDTEKSRR